MKSLKKFLFIFLALTLVFCMFSCDDGGDDDKNCTSHIDANEDGKCDKCGETMKTEQKPGTDLALVEDGEVNFQIIYAKGFSSDIISKINTIKTKLLGVGIEVNRAVESDDNVQECEVLIGNITTRGDKYKTFGYDYGKEGYIIKIVDSKLIINAGSEEMLGDALDKFLEDIIEIDDKEKDFENIVVKSEQQVEVIQDDYKITSITVDGKDMKGYTIAVNTSNTYHMDAAKVLQDAFYDRAGYWFEVVSDANATDAFILIKSVAKNAVEGGLKISVNAKGQLVIECGYDNMLVESANNFLSDVVIATRGALDFKGTVYTDDISVVYYKDFGAKGDGLKDDFQAILAAHEFANISGQTVKAESGKTYRIHHNIDEKGIVRHIPIKTDVIWTGAKFIIDDSDIDYFKNKSMATTNIFEVESDYSVSTITDPTKLTALAGIGEGTKKIDLGLNYPAMLIVYNANHEVYRRSGSSYSGAGQTQKEVIVIDKDGNVDESTPFMFDYAEVTSVEVYRLDIEPITIKGGEMTTQGCQVDAYDEVNDKQAGYYARGFLVNRSFTVVDGLKHYVVGEVTPEQHRMGTEGPHYSGFFYASNANDVLFKNCVLTGRRYYKLAGTYDFGAKLVNKIRLEGCVQSNFWIDENGNPSDEKNGETSMRYNNINGTKVRNCWGIGGTNFCKNMEYIDSMLSRFDAHCGLLNGKIINSTVNFMSLVGKGDMLIENTRWISTTPGATDNSMIYLRGDYGSPWDGTITIKDTVAVPSANDFNLVWHSSSNWYYGYECVFPNIIVDNLSFEGFADGSQITFVYDSAITSGRKIHLADFGDGSSENKNPIRPPEFIKIINNKKGYVYKIPDVPFFEETDLSECDEGTYIRK